MTPPGSGSIGSHAGVFLFFSPHGRSSRSLYRREQLVSLAQELRGCRSRAAELRQELKKAAWSARLGRDAVLHRSRQTDRRSGPLCAQRSFLSSLSATDERITFHLGRLEQRPVDDPAANELRRYLANLSTRIHRQVYQDLNRIARDHQNATALVEKAVDVMLAVDMVVMAERNEFDAAYLLSADGDFTPAVKAVREHGQKVYAVSPAAGAELGAVVNSFIRLPRDWFDDCYS